MASRSLGVLTIDLVAKTGAFVGPLDKAGRQVKKTGADFADSAKKMGIAFGALATGAAVAAAASLTMIVNRQRELIDVQSKSAQMLDTTYTSLANLARAGELGGVGMEKIEAASRQLSINLGRAIQGTGAQADAFDRLGLSAQELSEIPLDERIARINEALRTNVQASERAAVAADIFGARNGLAIQLLDPETIREAARQVEIFGLNLSDVDATKVEQANDALSTFGLLGDGIGKQITVQLAPLLQRLGDDFLTAADKAGGLDDVIAEVFGAIIEGAGFTADAVAGVGRALSIVANSGIIAYETLRLFRPESLGGAPSDEIMAVMAQAKRAISDAINQPLPSEGIKQWVRDAQTASDVAAEAAVASREMAAAVEDVNTGFVTGAEREKSRTAALREMESALEAIKGALDRVADSEARRQMDTNLRARSIADELMTEEESIQASYERRRQIILDNTVITGDAQSELLRRLEEKRAEELLELNGSFWEQYLASAEENLLSLDQLTADLLSNVSQQFGSAFEAMIFDAESLEDAVAGMAESILRSIVNAVGQMVAQWLALQAVQLLIGQTAQTAAVAGAAATGPAMAAAYAPAAAMASLASFGANAVPAMAGIAATTAAAQLAALTGMAHDGIDRVPRTGTWLLEEGERVMTQDTSARLDSMLSRMGGGGGATVNVHNAPPGTTATSRRGPDGRSIIEVLVADLQTDGPASRAMSGTYGLNRRGR